MILRIKKEVGPEKSVECTIQFTCMERALNCDHEKPIEPPREFIPFGRNDRLGCGFVVIAFGPFGIFLLGLFIRRIFLGPSSANGSLTALAFATTLCLGFPTFIAIEGSRKRTEKILIEEETITLMERGVPKIKDRFENVKKLDLILSRHGRINSYWILFRSGKRFGFSPDIYQVKELIELLEARTGKRFSD